MAGSNKKLTVSYGIFSCTLEGFDDPQETLKAVTQHFRDLAAADRHFGTQLPVFSPEMLERLVEKEIEARVNARMNEQGIFLNATATAPEALPPAEVEVEAEVEDDGDAGPILLTDAERIFAPDAPDPKVQRLMEKADSKLAGAEVARRRSAIEHLKAAVAATRAESGPDRAGEREARPYREDLRQAFGSAPADPAGGEPGAIRPRRPALSGDRPRAARHAPAAAGPKPAPLVLASEQRIDMPPPATGPGPAGLSPIRPRRVTGIRIPPATDETARSEPPEPDSPPRAIG